jgi:hypothetical protein
VRAWVVVVGLVATSAFAAAQRPPPGADLDLTGLTTPSVLNPGRSEFGFQLNAFGGFDKLSRSGLSYAAGFAKNWEASIAGTFGKESSVTLADRGIIDYGGSAGELLLKYRLPTTVESSLEIGIGYSHTPAQLGRIEALLGGSVGWSLGQRFRVYANPKLVGLEGNPLAAMGLGVVLDVTQGIQVFGDYTPILSGNNTISSADGSPQRTALYAVGIRLADFLPRLSIDLAYTNVIGETFGDSLTPSLGNTGGMYIGLSYRH